MNILKITLSVLLVIVLIGALSAIADANPAPTIPPRPTTPPSSSGGGGSSSGGNSGPTFTPFVDTLLSSDGSTVGTLTGKTAFVVDLLASNNSSVGGKNITLTMEAELTQRPSNAKLDIIFQTPDHSGLPKGMNDITALGMVNISKHVTYGWVVKPETVKLTFGIQGTPSTDPGAVYYLVRYDGSGY